MASSQAVVFERLAGQLGLVTLLAIGLILALVTQGPPERPDWLGELSAAFLGGGIAAGAVLFTILRASALARHVWAPLSRALAHPSVWPRQIALSLGTAVCNVASFALCAAAIGTTLHPITSIILIPLLLFTMLLPFSISGWGFREGAAVVLFPFFGASTSAGLAASVAFGLTILVSVLPGFAAIWIAGSSPSDKA